MTRARVMAGFAVVAVVALGVVAVSSDDGGLDVSEQVRTPGADRTDGAGGDATPQQRPTAAEPRWTLHNRRLVAAPVAAGGKVVTYTARNGRLSLTVVDPRTGEIVAQRPSSSSYVTPGVAISVVSRGNLVFHYRPTGRLQEARLEVYDVRRDRVVGRSDAGYFWSFPTGCREPDTGPVCVTVGDDDPASVYRVDPDTGRLHRAAPGVGRSLGAGLYDNQGLISRVYDSDRVWSRDATAMVGGRSVTPEQGWDWEHHNGYLIGSFGRRDSRGPRAWTKRAGHTARVDLTTGRPVWVRRGTAYCELDRLEETAGDARRWFRCATSGRAPATSDGSYETSAWKTAITRFDPETGEPLWTTKPARWAPIYGPGRWAKLSDTLVAGRRNGVLVTLDVSSGQVTRADPTSVGWCAQKRSYSDGNSYAQPQTRIARGLATPCRADGTAVAWPDRIDPAYGVRIDDVFVWASKDGLHAASVG